MLIPISRERTAQLAAAPAPAGSQQTLVVPQDSKKPADVVFIVHGSNLGLGGAFEAATHAAAIARPICARAPAWDLSALM